MTGDLTILGETRPVTLDVTINKAAFEQRGNKHKLGFSAHGAIKRSDFGVSYAVPFVGDEVRIIIEAEFEKPA
jgi:polyisoprenoid-binding protein YceI